MTAAGWRVTILSARATRVRIGQEWMSVSGG
jgi:hypothetical protein